MRVVFEGQHLDGSKHFGLDHGRQIWPHLNLYIMIEGRRPLELHPKALRINHDFKKINETLNNEKLLSDVWGAQPVRDDPDH